MNITLQEKTVLLIGGISPINQALCEALAEAGAEVWHQVFQEKEAVMSPSSKVIAADVRQPNKVKKLAECILEKDKKIDILIHSFPAPPARSLLETDPEEWLSLFQYHVDVPFLTCREIMPRMAKAHGGIVINISSSAAVTGEGGPPFAAISSTLQSMTRGLAREYKEQNVRVSGIAPAFLAKGEKENEQVISSTVAMTLLLCSDYGGYISGESILVDGGKSVG
ncbi:SDR family oxidoreductase [Domibacillus indicus]|uniref:SDR family NAD(P)-dependent oxidoreductase n=1 Tax=Domibacillus indicus TaxID=1437523 RepID=UPI00203FB235|nr:SDR family oxidoreductase [Domibacillus indicus]MCM3788736.1 SDR family oxidoreductase [Domibacillus indicus]